MEEVRKCHQDILADKERVLVRYGCAGVCSLPGGHRACLQATSGNTHTTLDTSVAALAELQGKLRAVEKQVMSTNRELVTVREEAKEVFRVRKSLLDNIAANQEAMKLAVSEIGTADAHIARLQTELQDLLSATSIDARRRSSVSRRRRSSLFQAAALAHMA